MPVGPTDISSQLHQRLLALIAQVQRDQADLKQHQSPGVSADSILAGDALYAQLFDAMQSTLHNLERSSAAEQSSPKEIAL